MEHQIKILMVDDEPFILSATAQFLRSSGYEVHTCDQWVGVAPIVRGVHPDLILMDYNMPGIMGDDLCRILKKNALEGHLRIVMFSSEPEADLRLIVERCGADGYIRKNVPGHMLLEMIVPHVHGLAVA